MGGAFALALALSGCTPNHHTAPTVAEVAQQQLLKLSSKVLAAMQKGSFGCGGDSQTQLTQPDETLHETSYFVEGRHPRPDGMSDVYMASILTSNTKPAANKSEDIVGVGITHDVVPTGKKLEVYGIDYGYELLHLQEQWRLFVPGRNNAEGLFYGTSQGGPSELPLTVKVLHDTYPAAEHTMDDLLALEANCDAGESSKV